MNSSFPTSHTVDRRDGAGALLGTIHEFEASYDAFGNPIDVTMTREDGALRKTSITYDRFGLAPLQIDTNATDTVQARVSITRDPVTLHVKATTDPTGTVYGTTYDGFDRAVLSTATPPGGPQGALSATAYRGFTVDEPPVRSIVQTVFTDPVPLATAHTAAGRTSTVVYLDELGRPMRTEMVLGSDYPGQTLIVGRRTYDSFGRVVFEADPFPSTQA